MHIFNRYFDNIYVITCLKCKDRQPYVIDHFNNIGIIFEFKYSLDAENFSDKYVSKTMKSLTNGHIQCIEDAIQNNYNKILICEDDVSFLPELDIKFEEFIKNIDTWDFLQLGNQSWAVKYLTREKIKDNLYKFKWGTGSHCVSINKSVFKQCIDRMSLYNECIDFMYYELFKEYIAYCPELFLADALSDNKHLNYDDESLIFKSTIVHGHL